ncbi:hypothetical protein [Alicyclobacillus sp. SO9]|nr:hypothetical protein [Alicyclobacillus sp. SO9]QQE80896.1 hypothetical protein GI364_11225 [Alicyclobacillus sp. SO9]
MSGFARKVRRNQMRKRGEFAAKHRAARYRRRGLTFDATRQSFVHRSIVK